MLAASLLCPVALAESDRGSVCVALLPEDTLPAMGAADLICDSNKFSLKVDARNAFSRPNKESVKIDGLDLNTRHRVVIYVPGNLNRPSVFVFIRL